MRSVFLSSQVCCNDFYTKNYINYSTQSSLPDVEQILIQILISLQFLFTQLLSGENQSNTKLLWFTEKTLKHCLVVEVWSCNVKQTNFELSVCSLSDFILSFEKVSGLDLVFEKFLPRTSANRELCESSESAGPPERRCARSQCAFVEQN